MKIHLILSTFLCATSGISGEVRLSLPQIPARVLRQNPELTAARLRIEEAQGRLLGAGRLSNPELGAAFTHDSRFREGTVAVSLDQRFPLTARLRVEKALSRQLVATAELEVRDAERKAIGEAQALAVRLLSLEEQRKLREEQTALAEKLSKFATDRSKTGEISALDAAQAQVDSQRLILEGRKVETERVSILGELKPKLGLSAGDALVIEGGLPAVAVPGLVPWTRRPDYQLAKVNEVASLTAVDLARSRKWQDMSAGLMWEGERMEDAPDGLQRTGFVGFRLSLPLPFWNRNEGEIAEKTAGATRASLETRALGKAIENEANAAREMMAAHAKLASDTKEKLLPLVVEQTQKLEKAYETGQADLLTVLRAREQRLQLQAAVLDATRDFHLARIRYEAAVGKHAPAKMSGSK
jgi:cobalt-zinc-cadmium efflux system outer membrane protein